MTQSLDLKETFIKPIYAEDLTDIAGKQYRMSDFKTYSVPYKKTAEIFTQLTEDFYGNYATRVDEDTQPIFKLVAACAGKPNQIFLLFRASQGAGYLQKVDY